MENDNPNIPYSGDNINNNQWNDFENNWLFHQFDNYLNGGALWQAAYPGESQYSEWSQQMVSTMYQNWYNSAPQAMKRAIEAGINPYIAAQGIAGVGNSGVASAPTAVNAPNLADVVSSAASGLSSLGSAFGNTAQGIATLGKLRHEIANIDANTENTFQSLGFTKLQSKALSIQLKYMDEKEQIGVWQALASYDKTQAEYQNLLAQHRNIIAQYDEIIAHKDLLIAQEGETKARELVNKAMKDKLETEARWTQIDIDFFTAHRYKLGTPVYDAIHDQMVSDGTFDMETYGNTISGYEGKVTSAVESAKAAASWNYRPSNVTEAAVYAGSTIGSSLRDVILSIGESKDYRSLFSKLSNNVSARREFTSAYDDARDDLYENYLECKRRYRHIRRGGNTQAVAQAKIAMDNAKKVYAEFTKEKFADELIKNLMPK